MSSPYSPGLPTNIDFAIQKLLLKKQFEDQLKATLGYRGIAVKGTLGPRAGTTTTYTRPSLLAPAITPINSATNVPLDNGLTPSAWTVEQYVLSTALYGAQTPQLNLIDDMTSIASIYAQNASNLGEQAFRTLDLIARNTLLNSYLGGNTRVDVTLGVAGPAVHVDDIRGFETVILNGYPTPVSPTNTLPVIFQNGVTFTTYLLQSAVPDVTNVSTALSVGGISGTLTFTTSVSTANATAGNPVVSQFAPPVVRPNGRTTTANLTSGDFLTLEHLRSGSTVLHNNGVAPMADGFYYVFYDPTSKQQLFSDPEMQLLYRGTMFEGSKEYRNMEIVSALGMKFFETTLAPQQTLGTVKVHRPFICGREVLLEERFEAGLKNLMLMHSPLHDMQRVQDIVLSTRKPIDVLANYITQAWEYVAGWIAPTDSTVTSATIPTASNAYYKRGVFIETA